MTKAEISKLFWEKVCCTPCLNINHEDFDVILFNCCRSCSDYHEGGSFERFDYSTEFVFDDSSRLLLQYDIDEDDFVDSNCEVLK